MRVLVKVIVSKTAVLLVAHVQTVIRVVVNVFVVIVLVLLTVSV